MTQVKPEFGSGQVTEVYPGLFFHGDPTNERDLFTFKAFKENKYNSMKDHWDTLEKAETFCRDCKSHYKRDDDYYIEEFWCNGHTSKEDEVCQYLIEARATKVCEFKNAPDSIKKNVLACLALLDLHLIKPHHLIDNADEALLDDKFFVLKCISHVFRDQYGRESSDVSYLKKVSSRLKDDEEVCLAACELRWNARKCNNGLDEFSHVSARLRDSESFLSKLDWVGTYEAFVRPAETFQLVSERLRDDEAFITQNCIGNYTQSIFPVVSERLRSKKDIVLAVFSAVDPRGHKWEKIEAWSKILDSAGENVFHDKDFCMELWIASKKEIANGFPPYKWFSATIRDDEDFSLKCVEEMGAELKDVSDRLKNCKEFVRKAVKSCGSNFKQAPENLRTDKDVCEDYINAEKWRREEPFDVQDISEDLLADEGILRNLMKKNPEAFIRALAITKPGPHLKQLVITAVQDPRKRTPYEFYKDHWKAFFQSELWQSDPDVVEALVLAEADAFKHASLQMQQDPAIVAARMAHGLTLEAFKNLCPNACNHDGVFEQAQEVLSAKPELVFSAVKLNPESINNLPPEVQQNEAVWRAAYEQLDLIKWPQSLWGRYRFYEGGDDWASETLELSLFPNGIVENYARSVCDRDTDSTYNYFGTWSVEGNVITAVYTKSLGKCNYNSDRWSNIDRKVAYNFEGDVSSQQVAKIGEMEFTQKWMRKPRDTSA
eukprot:CAMPEP_0181296466 /NCGR_PEP_ID=MMETSP1101-20121128/4719_1 /TAXON_ID=46948 /ORGANISM="Rhodomonas abbreviata, Strain Caron Lab Isolate" /LENGTH=716 /DNA_ID=CAMNT_0023401333 /DNA_START=81 /DNA_END=2231 /DNA_ORIENTATION=-